MDATAIDVDSKSSIVNVDPSTATYGTISNGASLSRRNTVDNTGGKAAECIQHSLPAVEIVNGRASVDYDPYLYGKEHQSTSFWGTVFHIIIISAGPGVFTLPSTFLRVDYPIAFAGTFFIVYLYVYNINLFVRSEYEICKRRKIPNLSYSDTVYYAFKDGPSALRFLALPCRYLIAAVFILIWIGNNSFNLILIGKFFREGLLLFHGRTDMSLCNAMLIMLVPLLLVSWIPNLKLLIPLSTAGSIMNWFVLGYMVWYIFNAPEDVTTTTTTVARTVRYGLADVSVFLGAILFCINATGIIMPLKNDMKHPSKFNSSRGVLFVSFSLMPVLFVFFCFLCVDQFSFALSDCVVLNLPKKDVMTGVVSMVFAASVCFSFPLTSYVAFDILWSILLKRTAGKLNHKLFWDYFLRTAVFAVVYALAIAIPNISVFLSVTGTIATPIDSMLFPAAVNTLVEWCRKDRAPTRFAVIAFRNAAIGVFAILLIALGVVNCISQFSKSYND